MIQTQLWAAVFTANPIIQQRIYFQAVSSLNVSKNAPRNIWSFKLKSVHNHSGHLDIWLVLKLNTKTFHWRFVFLVQVVRGCRKTMFAALSAQKCVTLWVRKHQLPAVSLHHKDQLSPSPCVSGGNKALTRGEQNINCCFVCRRKAFVMTAQHTDTDKEQMFEQREKSVLKTADWERSAKHCFMTQLES